MTQILPEYRTFDLGCAAALAATGFELSTLDKTNPRKAQFIFRKDAKLEEAVGLFWSDKLQVNARGYFEELKNLKNRIYSD